MWLEILLCTYYDTSQRSFSNHIHLFTYLPLGNCKTIDSNLSFTLRDWPSSLYPLMHPHKDKMYVPLEQHKVCL